jgi:hypothetical protein
MHIKTILNRVPKFKSFAYKTVCRVEEALVPTLEVELQPRVNSYLVYSGCNCKWAGYDTLPD